METPKKFNVILYGASGFTGKQIAYGLHKSGENLNWALCGRSDSKLRELMKELIDMNLHDITHEIIITKTTSENFANRHHKNIGLTFGCKSHGKQLKCPCS